MSFQKSEIEIYECDENKLKSRLPNHATINDICLSKNYFSTLSLNRLTLAHAVIKTDYLSEPNLIGSLTGILGFYIQTIDLIKFGTNSIGLTRNAKMLNDISLSSLAGRVAQGLTILYANHINKPFQMHLKSHILNTISTDTNKDAIADFLCADSLGNHYIFESKGSFSLPQNDPSKIKSVLHSALKNQVEPWMDKLEPAAKNGYAVYACLRESVATSDKSALFVVDPENGADGEFSISIDTLLRENYCAWLRVMGLEDIASSLATRHLKSDYLEHSINLVIVAINGREFAFSQRDYDYDWLDDFTFRLEISRYSHRFVDVGISYAALQLITKLLQNGDIQDLNIHSFLNEDGEEWIETQGASLFPDGSLLISRDIYDLDTSEELEIKFERIETFHF